MRILPGTLIALETLTILYLCDHSKAKSFALCYSAFTTHFKTALYDPSISTGERRIA